MYDNARDAQRYLDHSIIRIKNTPVMVIQCYEDGGEVILDVKYLRTGKRKEINIKDESLNFKPVPLGYGVTLAGGIYFVVRLPRRRWKQGLHQESLAFKDRLGVAIDLTTNQGQHSIANTIQGKFKSFKEALAEGGIFHRYFYIKKLQDREILEYKGDPIGSFREGRLELKEEYNYLEKYVEEVMV